MKLLVWLGILLSFMKCCKGIIQNNNNNNDQLLRRSMQVDASSSSSTTASTSEFPRFFSYECLSKVSDHAAVDMDQKEIISELVKNTIQGFTDAGRVYELGANSRSYANLTLLRPSPKLPDATKVLGYTTTGKQVEGEILAGEQNGDILLWFLYKTTEDLGNHVGCRVGGSATPVTDDCLAPSGAVHVIDNSSNPIMNYTYDPEIESRNGRRFIKFSLEAEILMYQCVFCPYEDYEKFVKYYGMYSYAHEWISSAFDGFPTNFKNGNVDFSKIPRKGRAEAIKTGTVYISLWMYIIREMEFALDHCTFGCGGMDSCEDKIYNEMIHAWDQAVAFYTGSLEQGGRGFLLYALADLMCSYFGTCWTQGAGEGATSTSYVNIEIFKYFTEGQQDLINGKCGEARYSKERIVEYMTVPLVQGTIHAAYLMGMRNYTTDETIALGASFAAAVLPLVHDCSNADADIIFKNMNMNKNQDAANDPATASTSIVNFQEVKAAFERNYECLGITCEDVGGVMQSETPGDYYAGCEPCLDFIHHFTAKSESEGPSRALLGVLFTIVITALITCGVCTYSKRFEEEDFRSKNISTTTTNEEIEREEAEEEQEDDNSIVDSNGVLT